LRIYSLWQQNGDARLEKILVKAGLLKK